MWFDEISSRKIPRNIWNFRLEMLLLNFLNVTQNSTDNECNRDIFLRPKSISIQEIVYIFVWIHNNLCVEKSMAHQFMRHKNIWNGGFAEPKQIFWQKYEQSVWTFVSHKLTAAAVVVATTAFSLSLSLSCLD